MLRRRAALLLPVGLLVLPAVSQVRAQNLPRTGSGVVIRERVTLHPDSATTTAAGPNASLSGGGPIAGYYVYSPLHSSQGNMHVVGAEFAGTLSVTTSFGATYAASLTDAWDLTSVFPPYTCTQPSFQTYERRYYHADESVELLRVPVLPGETVADSITAAGQTKLYSAGSYACVNTGDNPNCACYATHGHAIKGISRLRISRVFEPAPPPDTLLVTAQPDSLALGQTAGLTVIARDSLGSEVALDTATVITLSVGANPWGELVYGGMQGTQVQASYGAARAGAVRFETDSTAAAPPRDTTVTVTATGSGLIGTAGITLTRPCTREACAPGVSGPQQFDPVANVRVREPGQTLAWGNGHSMTVQTEWPLPPPYPPTPSSAGVTRPRFVLTDPGGDTLDVAAGEHLRFQACLDNGRWVTRVDSFFVPIVPEQFVSQQGYVDIPDTTAATFSSLVNSGLITSADTVYLRLDLKFNRFGPYAFLFYARVHGWTYNNGSPVGPPIDTTIAAMGRIYRQLILPLKPDIVAWWTEVNTLPPAPRGYLSSEGIMVHKRDHVAHVTKSLGSAIDSLFIIIDNQMNGIPPHCAETVVQVAKIILQGGPYPGGRVEGAWHTHLNNRPSQEQPDGALWWERELRADALAGRYFAALWNAIHSTHIPREVQNGNL